MSRKTARSSAVTVAFLAAAAIAVNTAPASAPMTFVAPIWRERARATRYTLHQVRCAVPAAVAADTACFVSGP